jgi:hypothetical protein
VLGRNNTTNAFSIPGMMKQLRSLIDATFEVAFPRRIEPQDDEVIGFLKAGGELFLIRTNLLVQVWGQNGSLRNFLGMKPSLTGVYCELNKVGSKVVISVRVTGRARSYPSGVLRCSVSRARFCWDNR